MILVAGPYRSGTDGDLGRIRRQPRAHDGAPRSSCTGAATCRSWGSGSRSRSSRQAGARRATGTRVRRARSTPIAERVLERCDACLRIGGPSEGADRMVALREPSRQAGLHRHRRRSRDRAVRPVEAPAFTQVRDDDRGRGARAGRAARLLRRRRAAEHRRQPGQADGRARTSSSSTRPASSAPGRRAFRCPSATPRS